MDNIRWQARTKRDFMIEVWEALDCESVGEPELRRIQQTVAERFGDGAVDSPAAIARVLADEGAVLRHPEVLDLDTEWREAESAGFSGLEFGSLVEAVASMRKLETARRQFSADGREQLISQAALRLKEQAQMLVRSRISSPEEKTLAREVAQWLTVWLGGPELFEEWIELRRRSPDFIEKFG